ncbi:MAG: hydroxyacid dehydrogenase [Gammaproteobacteria bacterium]|nr:hydroxyacid dehydrogenase [Gammaproteobacteria bacterium]
MTSAAPRLRIGLCVRGYQRIFDILREALHVDEVFECGADDVVLAAQDADVLIPIMTRIPPAALASPRLKLVQQYGVGLDIVDIAQATAAGVWVANVASVGTGNAESVAELAIAHLLMLTRQIPLAQQRFRERRFGAPLAQSLWRSTVLILGYGGIGEEIARRLAGFGCRVIAVSRHGPLGTRPRDPSVPLARHVAMADLPEVLGEADAVIVGAPASPENLSLVDAAMIAGMKRGVYVVNIARGQVLDYAALLAGLRSGQIAGAGLDVFWQEPFDPGDPLLLENVIPTPHVGGVTVRSLEGIAQAVAANLDALRHGRPLACCVNPHATKAC